MAGMDEESDEEQLQNREQLHEYWQDPDDAIDQLENQIEYEATSQLLLELIEPRAGASDAILELGCNVGRNLHFLHEAQYRNLHGVEINENALTTLEEKYPDLHQTAELQCTSIEESITDFATDTFDLTFTAAVLAHIHPESEYVFDEMVRVTDGYIVTLENEETDSYKQTARNYREVFGERGCEQIESLDGETVARRTEQRSAYWARVFETPESRVR